jgi:membrane protease YdiL (CAAX protease family)
MMLAETQNATEGTVPLWFLVILAACIPFAFIAVWRLVRWWTSADPFPLPVDKALPLVRWPPWVGLLLFAMIEMSMQYVIRLYVAAETSGLVPQLPQDWPPMLSPGVFLEQILPALAGVGAVFFFGRGAATAIGLRLGNLRQGLVYGVFAFAAILPFCLVAEKMGRMIVPLFGVPPTTHELLVVVQNTHNPWILPLALLQASVLAPLTEEFAFRGVLMMSLIRQIGAVGAIVFSSVVFAAMHFSGEPQAMPPLFLLAMAMGYVAYRTRSLVAPIVTHAIFNTVMIVQSFGAMG